MKISKIIAAGILTATMAAVSAVSVSAFDPSSMLGDATPTTETPAVTTNAAPSSDPFAGATVDTPSAGTTATPTTGNVNAPTSSDKGSPNTGVEDLAPLAGMAIVSAGVIFAAKKRK